MGVEDEGRVDDDGRVDDGRVDDEGRLGEGHGIRNNRIDCGLPQVVEYRYFIYSFKLPRRSCVRVLL